MKKNEIADNQAQGNYTGTFVVATLADVAINLQ